MIINWVVMILGAMLVTRGMGSVKPLPRLILGSVGLMLLMAGIYREFIYVGNVL